MRPRWRVSQVLPPPNVAWHNIDPETLSSIPKDPKASLPRKGRPTGTRRLQTSAENILNAADKRKMFGDVDPGWTWSLVMEFVAAGHAYARIKVPLPAVATAGVVQMVAMWHLDATWAEQAYVVPWVLTKVLHHRLDVRSASSDWKRIEDHFGQNERERVGYPGSYPMFGSVRIRCGGSTGKVGATFRLMGAISLYFLDAPMGTGKTRAIREHLRANRGLSVLSITFRQSLARYLSKELDLECYLDDGFWAPASRDRRRRCVVCLDSIPKLGRAVDRYELIVIDECVFVEYHSLAGTIKNALPQVLKMFQRLLDEAGRVICMQHRIPESTIAFYMSCMGIGAEDSNVVVRRKVLAPSVLHPMKVLTSRNSGINSRSSCTGR
ncbi:hypothetical protein V1525DRAFT_390235 [Lipomyces kononenkoae]|uniref:Uncharacterized protein n=1 Tax=Lipomyces kononenkoae TaxID=34357 RepID=A0ACC3SVW7_LIPKO